MPKTLRLVLGDQLNSQHSWFSEVNEEVTYFMAESLSETNYVQHHIQKVCGFFLAMRAFAQQIREQGHKVLYLQLDDAENEQNFSDNIKKQLEKGAFNRFEYLLPDEYRLDEELSSFCEKTELETAAVDTEHFLSERMAVETLFQNKKQYLLETFYRNMRKEYQLMMEDDGDTPLTGRWNYDQENRKKLPKKQEIPEPLHFSRNVEDITALLEQFNVETIGRVDALDFQWPVTREECLQLMDYFMERQLPFFGTYQDAMTERGYLLFHSKLSFGLNTKMLHPLEVCQAAIKAWESRQDEIDIAQVEGFVRQIIGWREYMRGIYWAKMPDYAKENFFNHQADLPDWYWTGKTKMNCLSHAIGQSLEHAYAHHIQRLMVTGNFALLLGVHPDEVDKWYLGIYMDAIEWVEITNTRGMSQFADGGVVGTKPYVSSANYIHKMSHYCKDCHYSHKEKTGKDACPFNSLYWDFYDRHRDKLGNNPRVGMMYRVWDKMDSEKQTALLERADFVKKNYNDL